MLKFIFLEIRAKSYFEVLRKKGGRRQETESSTVLCEAYPVWWLFLCVLCVNLCDLCVKKEIFES